MTLYLHVRRQFVEVDITVGLYHSGIVQVVYLFVRIHRDKYGTNIRLEIYYSRAEKL